VHGGGNGVCGTPRVVGGVRVSSAPPPLFSAAPPAYAAVVPTVCGDAVCVAVPLAVCGAPARDAAVPKAVDVDADGAAPAAGALAVVDDVPIAAGDGDVAVLRADGDVLVLGAESQPVIGDDEDVPDVLSDVPASNLYLGCDRADMPFSHLNLPALFVDVPTTAVDTVAVGAVLQAFVDVPVVDGAAQVAVDGALGVDVLLEAKCVAFNWKLFNALSQNSFQ
jgi:hypothetical protein